VAAGAEPAGSGQQHVAQGLLLAAAAMLAFSGVDAVGKHLLATQSAGTVTLGRYLFALPFVVGIWAVSGRQRIGVHTWRAHIPRCMLMAASTAMFFWALDLLPLVQVILLIFLAPLIVPFAAMLILGERLRPVNVAAALAGFGGVLVSALAPVPGPDATHAAGQGLGVLLAIGSAMTYAVAIVLLRRVAGSDGPSVIGLVSVVLSGALVAPVALAVAPLPDAGLIGWYLLFGGFGALAMWLLAAAYARAQAQVVAPMDYTAVVWAGLFGWLFFAELPGPHLWVSAAIIIGACAGSGWYAWRYPAAPQPA
jgi:S-adenosylmethionine uptake transporter